MLSLNSKSRKSIGILSAGAAAALLLTGLGVSNAIADTLNWNPAGSGTSSVGNAKWDNGVTSDWYDTTTSAQSTWAAGDGAYFLSTSSTDVETVTLAASVSAGDLSGTAKNGNSFAGNITFVGNGITSGSETLTVTGIAHLGGAATSGGYSTAPTYTNPDTFNLANIIMDSTDTAIGGSAVWGSVLNIGTSAGGAIFNASGYFIDGGFNTSTVNVNANSTLSVADQIRIGGQAGAGNTHGSTLNVNGGAVTVGGGGILLSTGATAGATGTLNMNSGTLNAAILNTAYPSSFANTGTLNLNGGILSTQHITETTGSTTIVNFNGGTLQALASIGLIGNPGSNYTVPTNLNVMVGGVVIDTNGYQPVIYNPLLNGTGGAADGGLTVENNDPSRGGISINNSTGALTITGGLLTITGANTYTGPTVINSDSALQLEEHTATSPNGGVTGLATIAKTSLLQIDSGGALVLNPDGVGTQISVGGLNLQGGIISFGFDGGSFQSLLAGTKASVSGTNIVNLTALTTAGVPTGTYTLIADSAGGLTGTFEFGNGSDTGTLTVGSNTYTGTLNNSATAETLTVSAVPEPTAVALLAVGALGLLLIRRRKAAA